MKTSMPFFRLVVAVSVCTASLAFAGDSTSLHNIIPTKPGTPELKSYFADQTTVPSVVTGADYYTNLGNCPGDANPNTNKIIPHSTPICPDINGYWPQNTTLPANVRGTKSTDPTVIATYCPDLCVTHRKTTTTSYDLSGATYTRVTAVTNAVCPTGYVQIAATDPDYAIANNPSNVPLSKTALGPADIDVWTRQGMTCAADTSKNFFWVYCDWSSDFTKSSDDNDCMVGTRSFYTNYLTSEISFAETTQCQTTGTKYSQGSACSIAYRTSTHSTKFSNYAAPIVCRIPQGYYYTDSKVPTTLVCARVKSVWNTRHN